MLKRQLVTIGTAAVLLPTAASAQGYGPQMMGWGGWGWGFGPIIGPFFMVLILAGIVAAVVLLVRAVSGPQSSEAPSGRRSLDILKERFARGEINKDEFEERRRVLGE